MRSSLLRKKPIATTEFSHLNQYLSALDLTLLGIGAIIGAGIFILTGIVAATKAGPGIIVSFMIAGLACGCSALSYAELAASIGGSGSAYSYAYVGFGEIVAWIIGWDLLLEYGISCPAVAIGWSSYAVSLLSAIGYIFPDKFFKSPLEGGIFNFPAAFIILFISFLLAMGIRQTALFNRVMVIVKLSVIAVFIFFALHHFNFKNWQPFLPFGFEGVIKGAGIIFFAYIGFDAISTAAEETINPQRNLPRGIIGSLVICTTIYIVVAALLTGMLPYSYLNVSSPVAFALLYYKDTFAASIVAVGAVAGLTTVILVMYYGLTRIFFAMAKDGLLPIFLGKISAKTKAPLIIILLTSLLMTLIAGILPIHEAAELVNIGTLSAFMLVCGGVLILRYTHPNIERPFKTPFTPWVPLAGMGMSFYLMINLARITWIRFFIWMALGLIIYFVYSRTHSLLSKAK